MKHWLIILLLCGLLAETGHTQSPYDISWKRDGWILGGSIAVSIAAAAVDDSLSALTQTELASLDSRTINPFDRWATNFASPAVSLASDYLIGICIAAPLGLMLADHSVGPEWQRVSLMYVETALLATFLPSFGKGPVSRVRPYLYNPNAQQELQTDIESRRSFFSGHTTWAFASMTFFATVYSDYHPNSSSRTLVWISSLSAASAVGLMRIFSGAHFPSDVLVGAAVGGLIGWGVPALHRVSSSASVHIQTPAPQTSLISLSIPVL